MDFLVCVSDQCVFAFFLVAVWLCAVIQSVTASPIHMRQKHTNVTENGTVANDTTTCPLNHIYCPHIGGCVEGISPDACHRDETLRYARGHTIDPLTCEPGKIQCADKECVDDKSECKGTYIYYSETTGQGRASGGGGSTVHVVGGAAGGGGAVFVVFVVCRIFRLRRAAQRVARVSSSNTAIGFQSSQPYRRLPNADPTPGNLSRPHTKPAANVSPAEGALPDKSLQPRESTVDVAEEDDVECLTP